MIDVQNVSIIFAGTPLLTNINFHVPKGGSLVLIGPSGKGKSVLLKMLAGIIPPSTGKILIDGKDLVTAHGKARDALLQKMGMLFQKNALFDSLTVGENIGFPLRETTDLSEEAIQEKIDTFLKAVGLSYAKDLFPDEISGGMQKRLGIARALALNPQIIFYDDPTAGLDPITSRIIIQLILELRAQSNTTLVSITNDINRAYQLADQIAMVVDGEVVLTGNKDQTKAHTDPRVHQFIRGSLEGPLAVRV